MKIAQTIDPHVAYVESVKRYVDGKMRKIGWLFRCHSCGSTGAFNLEQYEMAVGMLDRHKCPTKEHTKKSPKQIHHSELRSKKSGTLGR